MSCDHIRQLISESYDRRLTALERLQISEHLQTCRSCARFDRALRSGVDGVGHLAEITPSPRLRERVHTQSALRPRMTPGRVAQQAAGMIGAAAVVALVAVVTIFLLNNHTSPSPDKQPQIAAGSKSTATAVSTAPQTLSQAFVPAQIASPQAASTATSAASTLATTPVPQATPSAQPQETTTPTPIASATTVDEDTADGVVVGYFHAINMQDYPTAYAYLGSVMQQGQSLNSFASGFQQTMKDTLTITSHQPDDSGGMLVNIYLDAQQNDGSVRHYHGNYVVGVEDGTPKIIDATVVEDVESTPTPSATYTPAACTASLLSAKASDQGATGSMAGSIVFTNTGTDQCTLQGTADVSLMDAKGNKLAVTQKVMSLDGSEQTVTLNPGAQASLFFVWSNWCPNGTPETSTATPIPGGISLLVTLRDSGGTLTVPVASVGSTTDQIPPRCDAPGKDSSLSVGTFKTYPPS